MNSRHKSYFKIHWPEIRLEPLCVDAHSAVDEVWKTEAVSDASFSPWEDCHPPHTPIELKSTCQAVNCSYSGSDLYSIQAFLNNKPNSFLL